MFTDNFSKAKEDHSQWNVFSPHDKYHGSHHESGMPYLGDKFPEDGVVTISIDPGIKNFAMRMTRFYTDGTYHLIYFRNLDFTSMVPKEECSENKGLATASPVILQAITKTFMASLTGLAEARIICIERQMAKNVKATKIFHHVLGLFLTCQALGIMKYPCCIFDFSPKLKGKMLGAPERATYNELKAWSIEKAIEICTHTNDQDSIRIIKGVKGRSKTKGDDLSDTITQLMAFYCCLGPNGFYELFHTEGPQKFHCAYSYETVGK